MKQALTAEEWAKALSLPPGVILSGDEGTANRHSLAAVALYGQPFGFTREDVTFLEEWRQTLMTANFGRGHGSSIEQRLASLADRIEALLPPETIAPIETKG